jgi:hypothetical protein
MNANKIELNGEVLLDLTQDTVTEADVAEGKTFHLADGTPATGTGVMGGGGGGSALEGAHFIPNKTSTPNKYYQKWFKINGELYALTLPYNANGSDFLCYKYTGSGWEGYITTNTYIGSGPMQRSYYLNGKFHFVGGNSSDEHHAWGGGTTVTKFNDLPGTVDKAACVYQGTLFAYAYDTGKLYSWAESTDTWTEVATIGSKYDWYYPFVINGNLYFVNSKTIYRYDNGALTQIGTASTSVTIDFVYGSCVYYRKESYGERRLFKFDVETLVETHVGCYPVSERFFQNASDDPADRPSFMIGDNNGFTCYDFYEFEATE